MKQHWGIAGKTDFQELNNILLESLGGNPGRACKFAVCAFTCWEVWVFPAGRSSGWIWSQVLKIHEQTNQQIQRIITSAGKSRQILTFNPSESGEDLLCEILSERKTLYFYYLLQQNWKQIALCLNVSEMGSMTQSVLHFPSGCNKMTFIAHLRLCPFRVMGHSLVSGNKLHYIPLHTDGFSYIMPGNLKKRRQE